MQSESSLGPSLSDLVTATGHRTHKVHILLLLHLLRSFSQTRLQPSFCHFINSKFSFFYAGTSFHGCWSSKVSVSAICAFLPVVSNVRSHNHITALSCGFKNVWQYYFVHILCRWVEVVTSKLHTWTHTNTHRSYHPSNLCWSPPFIILCFVIHHALSYHRDIENSSS